jgi:GST-like protein
MFEALAILQWLGDRFGVARGLWPAMEDPARLQALAWTTWGYVSYGAVVARLFMSTSEHVPAELHNAAHAERAKQDLGELLDILEDRLSAQDHLLGKDFSLVDLVVAQVVVYSTMVGADVADRKHVRAWLESIQGRRAFKTEWS